MPEQGDVPHREPVALVSLDALVIAAPRIRRLAPDKAIDPDRQAPLLVELAQEAHVGRRERRVVHTREPVLQHREGRRAEELHPGRGRPGRDDSSDEGHGVVEEDAGRAAVGGAHDLAARDVEGEVDGEEGEDGTRDPEGVDVDCGHERGEEVNGW